MAEPIGAGESEAGAVDARKALPTLAVQVTDPEYQNHAVFAELGGYIAFYHRLADSVFLWAPKGTSAILNVDSYVFSSIEGTLTSIQMILRDGRINDAYSLLRKYYDSTVINIYSTLFLEQNFSIQNLVVEQIDGWLKGKTRLPAYRVMSQYVRSSPKAAPLDGLFADQRYKRVRDRCNDHTHYNFFHNVLLNDSKIFLRNRARVLNEFSQDARDVFILHVAFVFFLNNHYMMSSDYVDALECNVTPEPDSQYWVAPFIQDLFDGIIAKVRPDVAAIINAHTSMHLS